MQIKIDLKKDEKRLILKDLLEKGLDAIDPQKAIFENIKINETEILVGRKKYDLKEINRISVIGFGKAACSAGTALEKILKNNIKQSAIIGLPNSVCEIIQTYGASHPLPSAQNVSVTKNIIKLSQGLTKNDLVFVIVSGGGSAMLCYPYSECEQSLRLYEDFLETGGTIKELNTVRKHLSEVKGGGLAKMLFPAKVASLVISDIPGGYFSNIASGPTYFDISTKKDAEVILDKYGLKNYNLIETPKEHRYFKNVYNLEMLSNKNAIYAMKKRAKELGYIVTSLGSEIFDNAEEIAKKHLEKLTPKNIIISGGEARVTIKNKKGLGGRNSHSALSGLFFIENNNKLFCSFASDGIDNNKYAGALMDKFIRDEIREQNLDWQKSLRENDSLSIYKKTSGLIETGPTGTNVSDLYIAIY